MLGGRAEDTLLTLPTRIAADRAGVSVLDGAGGRVRRFSREGRLLWTFGRRGRGPAEFWRPRDIQLDRFGRSWVLDPGNSRLVGIDSLGSSPVEIPLSALDRPPNAFVPLPAGGALLLTFDPERPFVRVSDTGRVLERMEFPWLPFRSLHPLAAQLVTGMDPASDRWAVAFGLGDGFFVFQGLEWLGYRGRFVETAGFPRVEEARSRLPGRRERVATIREARFMAEAVSLSEDRLFVFFGGGSRDRHRLIDAYSSKDGVYLGTFRLPVHPRWAVYAGGLVYAIYEDPYPTLAAWRPKERKRS